MFGVSAGILGNNSDQFVSRPDLGEGCVEIRPCQMIEMSHADAMRYLYSQGLQKSFIQDGLIMDGTISADKVQVHQLVFPGDKPCRYCGRKKRESGYSATCAGCGAPL